MAVKTIKARNWRIVGNRATPMRGATLWDFAEAITGKGGDWVELGHKAPRRLLPGRPIDITPLLRLRRQRPRPRRPGRPRVRAGGALGASPSMVTRAKMKRWRLEGSDATALGGATLSGLAEAITGNGADYELLQFERHPRTLRAGESVSIIPLLEKAIGRRVHPPVRGKPRRSRPTQYDRKSLQALAKKAAVKHRIPPAILKGLIQAESGWRVDVESSKKALGLTQLIPGTARDLGLRVDQRKGVDERLDPAKNIDAGARYLRRMYERMYEAKNDLERWRLALAAYNCGPGNVNDFLRKIGRSKNRGSTEWRELAPHARGETRKYVRKILGVSG